jgi:hypothetical protein
VDLDRIRACIEINELPSFALVQSICPGELISSVAPAFSCLSLGCVLVGANISHLNSAVVTPAAKPPTAAPPTPKPRQSLLTVLTSGVKMKATATARRKSAAKAAVSDLPAGQALKSASLPVKSKKRKHRHSIEEVGRSDNAVGDWQQRADAERIVDNIFATTNDNPERMEATLKRVISHPALQPHLPTEVTRRHSEEQHARRNRRGSGCAASYKLANQASSAGVWRRESAKRRTRTSFIPCLLLALSLARRPGRLPCLLRLCSP